MILKLMGCNHIFPSMDTNKMALYESTGFKFAMKDFSERLMMTSSFFFVSLDQSTSIDLKTQ